MSGVILRFIYVVILFGVVAWLMFGAGKLHKWNLKNTSKGLIIGKWFIYVVYILAFLMYLYYAVIKDII